MKENTFWRQAFGVPDNPETYLDILRIIAIIFVMFNHTGAAGFGVYTRKSDPALRFVTLSISAVIRTAVPMFFMISGALLLGRDEPFKKIFVHRFLRYGAILALASLATYLLNAALNGTEVSFVSFLQKLYGADISGPFWYLYHYLAYLCMLPFIRILAKGMERFHAIYLLAAYEVMTLWPAFNKVVFAGTLKHSSHFAFFINCRYVLYPLMGYYIARRIQKKEMTLRMTLCLAASSLVSLVITFFLTERQFALDGSWEMGADTAFLGIFTPVLTVTLFYICRFICERHPASPRGQRVLSILGRCTFGAYLFEGFFRRYARPIQLLAAPFTGTYIAIWLKVLAAVVMGIGVTFVFKAALGWAKGLIRASAS